MDMLLEKKEPKTPIALRLGPKAAEAYNTLPDLVTQLFPELAERYAVNKNTLCEAALAYFLEELQAGRISPERLFGPEARS